jgi:hypothetical protein
MRQLQADGTTRQLQRKQPVGLIMGRNQTVHHRFGIVLEERQIGAQQGFPSPPLALTYFVFQQHQMIGQARQYFIG